MCVFVASIRDDGNLRSLRIRVILRHGDLSWNNLGHRSVEERYAYAPFDTSRDVIIVPCRLDKDPLSLMTCLGSPIHTQ